MVVVVGVGLHEAVLAPAQDGLAADAVGLGQLLGSHHPALPQSIVAALQPILHADARDDLAVEAMALAGAEAALVQDGGDLGFRVLCEQAVDLRDPWASASSSRPATGVAAKRSVSRRRENAHARRWPLGL